MTTVYIFLSMVGLGVTFGFLLALANNKLVVEVDPRIYEVDDVLPKGQCGACGFAGCLGYADAVVKNPDVPPNLCIPGKAEVARRVAEITGKQVLSMEIKIASLKCAGTYDKAKRSFEYDGLQGCVSASLLQGGNKGCTYGCLGFGTCVRACLFGAMKMSPEGLPLVNSEKCTGCGKCVTCCPRNVLELIDPKAKVRVNCSSHDRGVISKRNCSISCIGCGLCARHCPYLAITMDKNLAVVNTKICLEKCADPVCLAKCPTKAIRPVVFGVLPGTEKEAATLNYKGYDQA